MWKVNPRILAALCVFLLAVAFPAGAVTHHVSPGQSIQAAIDDANDGDQIEVGPWTYNEANNFDGKSVNVVFAPSAKRTCSTSPSHEDCPRDAVWACPPTRDHANTMNRSPPSNEKHL
jgi:hypothetical protein